MPRVLIAHPSPDLYGSDRQLVESVQGLITAGWSVALILPAGGPLVAFAATAVPDCEVRIAPFPVLRKALLAPKNLLGLLARLPRDLVRLIRLIRRERPDVVYVNTVTIPWWILAARLAAVPVVAHVHEAEEDSPRLIRLGLNAPMLLARRVISNSRSSAEVVAAAVPRLARRTVVVPNGVPDRGALPRDAVHPGRLVLVGRLSPRKGTDVALEALALVRRTRPEASLVLCGTAFEGYEWFEAQLRGRAAAPDLDGAVEFAGYVESTAPVLASAEVVLVPSRTEPFGNTAVEAELAERPLVASGVQGLAEIVQDGRTGLLVPPGDAPALAAAVERVLADPELATRLARDGRADALARFSTERYQRDIVTVLTSARRGVRA